MKISSSIETSRQWESCFSRILKNFLQISLLERVKTNSVCHSTFAFLHFCIFDKSVWSWKRKSTFLLQHFFKPYLRLDFWKKKNSSKISFLEISREISILNLNLESFSFHIHFSKKSESKIFSLCTSRKKVKAKKFTFHFSDKSENIFFHFSLLGLFKPTLAGPDLSQLHKVKNIWACVKICWNEFGS